MKFSANAKQFKESWAKVARVIPRTTPKPILQSAILSADGSGVRLAATNLDISISVAVGDVQIDEPGRVLLPRAFMDRLLPAADSDALSFDASDRDKLIVKGSAGRWTANTEDPDVFPSLPAMPAASVVLCAADLKLAIKRTVVATDPESTRYALGGCSFEAGATGDTIRMVATDGRRLALAVVAWLSGPGIGEGGPYVAPKALLDLVAAAISDENETVEVAFARSAAFFRVGDVTLSGRLVEGRFPRWADVFPAAGSGSGRGKIDAGAFRRLIAGASVSTSEESRGVVFSFGEPGLFGGDDRTLTARAACETSKSEAQIPATYDGDKVSVSMDPRYLLDGFATIDQEIEWAEVGEKIANVFRVPNFDYVVMPLTKDR